jgi:hypothetical protein
LISHPMRFKAANTRFARVLGHELTRPRRRCS